MTKHYPIHKGGFRPYCPKCQQAKWDKESVALSPPDHSKPAESPDAQCEERVRQARIEELESLEHEPQMHGDWQQALADRLDTLREAA